MKKLFFAVALALVSVAGSAQNLKANMDTSVKPGDDSVKYLMFATRNGIVKRTAIEEFDSIRKSGKIAIVLKENNKYSLLKI